ncbi:MAG: hypothetical protein V4584_08335 [Verrucomicrobiota bacterium]
MITKFFLTTLALLPLHSLLADPFEVKFLAWDEQIATRKLGTVGGEITGLHPLQRTPNYKVNVENGVFPVQAIDKKNDKGEPAVLSIKVPAGTIKPLVILLPKPDAPSGLASLVIEDDESSLKWGSIRAFNSTSGALAMAIGNDAKSLPAGWKPIDFQPDPEKTVSLQIGLPAELRKPLETRQLLFSTVWTPDSETRSLAIIVPGTDVRLGPLAIKVITEDRRTVAAQRSAAGKR